MKIKELTKQVEEATGGKVTWELKKKFYIALDPETYRVVAEYNLRTGRLIIFN